MSSLTEHIFLKCKRCEHRWEYNGKNQYVVSCPHCRTSVMYPKELREIKFQKNSEV